MLRGWHSVTGLQGMSSLSGVAKTGGQERSPGGKFTGSLQDPLDWQVDMTVISSPVVVVQEGHLSNDLSNDLKLPQDHLRGVAYSSCRNIGHIWIHSGTSPASQLAFLQIQFLTYGLFFTTPSSRNTVTWVAARTFLHYTHGVGTCTNIFSFTFSLQLFRRQQEGIPRNLKKVKKLHPGSSLQASSHNSTLIALAFPIWSVAVGLQKYSVIGQDVGSACRMAGCVSGKFNYELTHHSFNFLGYFFC